MRGLRLAVGGILLISCMALHPGIAPAAEKEPAAAQPSELQRSEGRGEGQPSPEEQQMMQQMMGSMMGLMMEGMARSMAKPEFAKNMAIFMRNYYKALIEQGFTEEEAMRVVISSGLPSLGGQR